MTHFSSKWFQKCSKTHISSTWPGAESFFRMAGASPGSYIPDGNGKIGAHVCGVISVIRSV